MILTGRTEGKLSEPSRAPALAGPVHASRLPSAPEYRPAHNDRIRCINDYIRLGAPAASLSWPDPAEPGSPVPLSGPAPVPPGDWSLAGVSSPAKSPTAIPPVPVSPAHLVTQRLTVSQCLDGPSRSSAELSFTCGSRASVKNSAFITVLAPTPKEPNAYRNPESSLERTLKNSAFINVLSPTPKEPNPYGHPQRAAVRTFEKLSFYHCFSGNPKGTNPLRPSRPFRIPHLENSAFITVLIGPGHNMPSCATALTNVSDLSPLQTESALLRPVVHRYNYGLSIDDWPAYGQRRRTTTMRD